MLECRAQCSWMPRLLREPDAEYIISAAEDLLCCLAQHITAAAHVVTMDGPPAEIKLADQADVVKAAQISTDVLNTLKRGMQQGRYLLNDEGKRVVKEALAAHPHDAPHRPLDMAKDIILQLTRNEVRQSQPCVAACMRHAASAMRCM